MVDDNFDTDHLEAALGVSKVLGDRIVAEVQIVPKV